MNERTMRIGDTVTEVTRVVYEVYDVSNGGMHLLLSTLNPITASDMLSEQKNMHDVIIIRREHFEMRQRIGRKQLYRDATENTHTNNEPESTTHA